MIRLDRKHAVKPLDWEPRVEAAFADFAEFVREAERFEKLPLSSTERRAGFARFAPKALRRKSGTGKAAFPDVWGTAKDEISKMSHGKCAYCEGGINAKRSCQVEHFRPKSLFPAKAYRWENYVLACGGCNGPKRDKWPEKGGYLRPDRGDPSRSLCFREDGSVSAVAGRRDAARTVVDFELDREALRIWRGQWIRRALTVVGHCAKLYRAGLHGMALEFARSYFEPICHPQSEYSAAISECFLRAWDRECPGVRLPGRRRRFF